MKCYLNGMVDDYLKMILRAPVYDVAKETPLDAASNISRRLKNRVLLKREDMQTVFSYKIRGAYNLMSSLSTNEREKGVIAASAGNHAQGVALAANELGCPSIVVMQKTTPNIKIDAVSSLGAEVILHGNAYDEAEVYAKELASERQMVFVPPYDHPLVIAGQGTVAMEIMRQHSGHIDAIFVPVGGGGLIAGIAAFFKALAPRTKIIGVEPNEAPSMSRSLASGHRVRLETVGIFADGAAVRQVGEETFRIAQESVDEILTVSTDEICASVKDIFEDTRSIAEPAGALALAGLKQFVQRENIEGQDLIAILSGANVNFDRLRHIAELAELGEHREILIGASIPEKPGSFRDFCESLGPRLITEFNYRFSDTNRATVFVGIKITESDEDRSSLMRALTEKGYNPVDMSENEIAKMHVRFMVGGHGGQVDDECLLRVEFPERPGALLSFLSCLGSEWNISLFHYRNHGAAYGRVLIGLQIPESDRIELSRLMDSMDMVYEEETSNPAYKMFLR